MKKNMMMRVAFVLLIAVLLTTSVIGGTFAKYTVSSETGSDSARIAKFGVSVQVEDDFGLFKTEYEKDDATANGGLSVKASTSDRVIAPGTKGGMKVTTLAVNSEVATRVRVNFPNAWKTIQLPAGKYTLPAGAFTDQKTSVTTTEVYEPIKFYCGYDEINEQTRYIYSMERLQGVLSALINSSLGVNSTIEKEIYIGWYWPFENPDVENADFFDTYLGYEAANGNAQEVSLSFNITIEQVD